MRGERYWGERYWREREREIDTHTRMAKEGKREAFQMEAI
jgi:hypothetical protein